MQLQIKHQGKLRDLKPRRAGGQSGLANKCKKALLKILLIKDRASTQSKSPKREAGRRSILRKGDYAESDDEDPKTYLKNAGYNCKETDVVWLL